MALSAVHGGGIPGATVQVAQAGGAPAKTVSLQGIAATTEANKLSSTIGNLMTATPFCSGGPLMYKICQDVVSTAGALIDAVEDPKITNEDLMTMISDGKLNSHGGRYARAVITSEGEDGKKEIMQGAGFAKTLDPSLQMAIASTKNCFYNHEDRICIAFEPTDKTAAGCDMHVSGPSKGLPKNDNCEVFPVVHILDMQQHVGRKRGWTKRIGGAILGGALGYATGGGAVGAARGAITGLLMAW